MTSLTARRGGALAMVILLITVMTIALAAAYTLNGTEIQVGDDYSEQVAALALAESGRNRFLVDRAGLGFVTNPPGALEVDTLAYPGGQAIVTLVRIRPQVQQLPPLYLFTSRGMRTGVTKGNVPPAERTVAQYMYWDAMPINLLAGWTSLSGLNKNGAAGTLSGVDASCGTLCGCPAPLNPVAGVAVPTVPGMTGQLGPAVGSPPIKPLGDAAATRGAVDIDWAGIVNGTADMTYNVIIPGGTFPTAAQFADPNFWPTIKVNGDLTLSTPGRGTLIVTGTLTQNNGSQWDGVVLVGQTLVSNGATGVHGATVTGLNILLGQAVPIQDIGNGTKLYDIDSCKASRALNSQAKLRPLPNTWMDNWASY